MVSRSNKEIPVRLDVINDQIRSVLDNEILSANTNMLIAYEPIWAIGTGLTATPDMANEVHAYLFCIE